MFIPQWNDMLQSEVKALGGQACLKVCCNMYMYLMLIASSLIQ